MVQQCSSRIEPPSLNTASLLLTQALENAVKTYGMGETGKSACVPGGAKSVTARQQMLSDAVQNRPGKIFLQNADTDTEILVKKLKKCAVRRSS